MKEDILSPFITEPINTQQRWNRQSMGILWKRRSLLDPQTASFLDGLYKGRKKGSVEGSTHVTYALPKKSPGSLGYGRLYGSHGSLERLENECRGSLCDAFYYDIDLANAHPEFLWQIAEQVHARPLPEVRKYCERRDEYLAQISPERDIAKTAILKIMYGGKNQYPFLNEFQKEIEEYTQFLIDGKKHTALWKHCQKYADEGKSPRGSFLSTLLQTVERRVMLYMRSVLTVQGWSVDVLTYDGVMVRKSDSNILLADTLLTLERDIKNMFGLQMRVVNKAFISYEFSEEEKSGVLPAQSNRNPLLPLGSVIDDKSASVEFARLMGSKLVKDSGVIWIFSDEDGRWHSDKATLARAISLCGWKLFWQVETPLSIQTHNYSGLLKNKNALISTLPDVLHAQDGFFDKLVGSDVNKILFSDGIYNFETGIFTAGFTPSIHFTASIPRPFTRRNQTLIDVVYKRCFVEPFSGTADSSVLRHSLMRALIGDVNRKKFLFGLGYTNSGKSLLIRLCQTAFGSYVNQFTGNDMLAKRTDGESSRSLNWLSSVVNGRFGFSSEISTVGNPHIDGNLLKQIASGGDEITVREIYEKSYKTKNRATLFMFGNAMPVISPVEDALRNRINVVNWSYSFIDFPQQVYERPLDRNLSAFYSEPATGDALFWILVDEYEAWKATGFTEPVIPDEVKDNAIDVIPSAPDLMEIMLYNYTVDEERWTSFKDIQTVFKEAEIDIGKEQLGFWLKSHFNRKIRKLNGKQVVGYRVSKTFN